MADSVPDIDRLATALAATGVVIAGVSDEAWGAATVCAPWTVMDVTRHLVLGNRLFAGIMRAAPAPPVTAPPVTAPPVTMSAGPTAEPTGEPAADLDGDVDEDPVSAYRQAAGQLLAAFARPGVLDQVVTVPFGTVPGRVALRLRITEVLIHGWDVASATGQDLLVPASVVEPEIAFSRDALSRLPADRTPFRPSRPAPERATPLDRLAALLGREVDDPSPPADVPA